MKRAFAHLKSTRNPFGEPAPQQRGRLAVVDVDKFVEALRQPGNYIEFRGKQGRGKSTRLHAIAKRLDAAQFVRIPQEPELARRIEWARRSEAPVPTLSDSALDRLIAEYREDLRWVDLLGGGRVHRLVRRV